MQTNSESKSKDDKADKRGYEAFQGSLQNSMAERQSRKSKIRTHFGEVQNWITLAMFIITSLYTAVTIGLYLVARDANRVNVDGRRAWMSGPELVDGKFVFKNVGQTPTDGLYIDMEPLKSGESGSDAILKICARIKADYEIKKPPFSAIPAANWLVSFSDIPSAKLFPANFPQGGLTSDTRIVGCTIYRTPSDQRLHQTGFEAFVLSQAGGVLSQTGGPSLRYSYTEHAD